MSKTAWFFVAAWVASAANLARQGHWVAAGFAAVCTVGHYFVERMAARRAR